MLSWRFFKGFSVITKNLILTGFVTDMFEKRDLLKSQRNYLLQNLAKKIGLSVYRSNTRKDTNEEYICVTES